MTYKFKKGDISLIIVILVSGIILSLLIPLSQKISVESNISRENLMSQQAIQAAKTGLEDWRYNITYKDTIDYQDSVKKNWPNDNTISLSYTVIDDWIVLVDEPNQKIQYKVEFEEGITGTSFSKIIATGRVERNGFTVDRTLEETFTSN
jgi:type II secretory pathway pseudopilin PulG